tara:strand:+ start:3341 stop:3685 length:345 start_codon:yes stop_codon:yes gene_type:complete
LINLILGQFSLACQGAFFFQNGWNGFAAFGHLFQQFSFKMITDRLTGYPRIDASAMISHSIKIGGRIKWIPVGSGCVPPLLIPKKDDQVRSFAHSVLESFFSLGQFSLTEIKTV